VIDSSTWRLPPFVSHAFHREDLARSAASAYKTKPLSDRSEPSVGDLVALQCNLRTGEWGVLKGLVTSASPGRVTFEAASTTIEVAILDGKWRGALRHYPEAMEDGPWLAESLVADGVTVIRRTWISPLLKKLAEEGAIVFAPDDLDALANRVADAAFEYCTTPNIDAQAELVARRLARLFEQDAAIEEVFVDAAELKPKLLEVWSPGEA
jgi:hypothetical protein